MFLITTPTKSGVSPQTSLVLVSMLYASGRPQENSTSRLGCSAAHVVQSRWRTREAGERRSRRRRTDAADGHGRRLHMVGHRAIASAAAAADAAAAAMCIT